jgi:YesN/AraC family two-component response regulator
MAVNLTIENNHPQPLRVVAADDDAEIRRYYHIMIHRLGHQVVAIASNGYELFEFCHRYTPDVAVTESLMPGLNGLDAIGRIEGNVLFVVVSAYDKPDSRQLDQRVVTYLLKPIRRADLQTALMTAAARLERA